MAGTTIADGWVFTVTQVGKAKAEFKFRDSDEDPPYLLFAQLSPSSQAVCSRGCGEKIMKGDVRLGVPMKDPRGTYGVISGWKHLRCTRLKDAAEVAKCVPSKHVYDFSKLDKEQQAAVVAELAEVEAPAHLKTLDPEDPTFLGERKLSRTAAPPTVALQLLPYQEEGFGWMVKQEAEHQVQGGILADEM